MPNIALISGNVVSDSGSDLTAISGQTYSRLHSGRDFPNGTLIETTIDYSLTNGDPWVLEITGNSYFSLIPFDLTYQGYIYNNTMISMGGMSTGTTITGMSLFNYNGKLCFWFPSQGYWQGFNVFVYTAQSGRKENRVTAISNVAKPAGITKELSMTFQQIVRTSSSTVGTVNYVSKFTANGILGDSQIFDNGTNVGIGVVPISTTLGKSLFIASSGNGLFTYDIGNTFLTQNTYYNSTWKYANTAAASQYILFNGDHLFITAPSGTAGTNVTLTERMRITQGGNVGIGTVSPGFKLDVSGSIGLGYDEALYFRNSSGTAKQVLAYNNNVFLDARDGYISFRTDASGTITERVRVTAAGNVGINNTAPYYLLDVNGNIGIRDGNYLYMGHTSLGTNWTVRTRASGSQFQVDAASFRFADVGYTNAITWLAGIANGNVGIGTGSPTYGLTVEASTANSGTGTALIKTQLNGSGKGLVIDSTTRTTADNAVLALEIINRAGGNTLAATVSGNVGIGTTSPTERLHVVGNTIINNTGGSDTYPLVVKNTLLKANNNYLGLKLQSNDADALEGVLLLYGGASKRLEIGAYDNNVGPANVTVPYGNFGIGTTSPTQKLDVNGTTSIFGTGSADTFIILRGFNTGGTRFQTNSGFSSAYNGLGITTNYTNANSLPAWSFDFGGQDGINFLADAFTVWRRPSGGSYSNLFTITSAGNVGIGNTNPGSIINTGAFFKPETAGEHLDILSASSEAVLNLRSNRDTSGGQVGGIYFTRDGGQGDAHRHIGAIQVRQSSTGSLAGGSMLFFTKPTSSGAGVDAARMTIDNAGGITIASLAGTGTRIVTADANGFLAAATLSSSVVGGSGTTNYIAKFTASGTVGNSQVFDNGTYVRIGTTADLNLGLFALQTDGGTNPHLAIYSPSTTNGTRIILNDNTNSAEIRTIPGTSLTFRTNGLERLRIASDGSVGIGTASPAYTLDVVGQGRFTGQGTGTAIIGNAGFTSNYTGISLNGTLSTSSYNILSSPTEQTLYINRPSGFGIRFREANGDQMIIASGGNVGIGTISPQQKLVVSNAGAEGLEIIPAPSANANQIQSYNRSTSAFNSLILRASEYNVQIGTTAALYISTSGNVGIGTTAPQKPLEVIVSANDFASVGVNQISPGQWAGIHFGYRESNNLYRKSAIVFERTDLTSNNAQGKVHILNGPQGNANNATLADARLTIAENGNIGIGTTAPSYNLQVGSGTTAGNRTLAVQDSGYGVMLSGGAGAANNYIQSIGTTIPLYFRAGNSNDANYIFSSTGRIGISNTAPAYKVDTIVSTNGVDGYNVYGAQGGANEVIGYRASQANGIGLIMGVTGANASSALGGPNQSVIYGVGSQTLILGTNSTARVTIFNNGRVFVGPSAADAGYQFDVNGTTRFGGAVTFNSAIYQKDFSTIIISNLGANATQARQFEILRGFYDFNDWSPTGVVEIEVYERYWSRGLKKVYTFSYGYYDSSSLFLTEMTGGGDNNFRVTMGAKVLISGDMYYVPIYVEVRNYVGVDVIIRTRRTITTNNLSTTPGALYVNESPSAVDISDFTSDTIVYPNNAAANQVVLGNLGIGSNPSYKLDVDGITRFRNIVRFKTNSWNLSDDGQSRFYYENAGSSFYGTGSSHIWRNSSDVTLMTLLSSGNLGINTGTPAGLLDISGGQYNTGLIVRSSSANGSGVAILNSSTGGKHWYIISTGGNNGGGAGNLGFYNDSDGDYRVYFSAAGNVGIGTTSPSIPRGSGFRPMLHVYNNSVGTNPAVIVSCENSQKAGFIAGDNAGASDIGWGFNAYYEGNGNNFFNIRIGDNGVWTDRFTIDRFGSVGIGTTAPGGKLHIVGATSGFAITLGTSVANNPLFIDTYNGTAGIGMDQGTAGVRIVGDHAASANLLADIGYYTSGTVAHANWVSRLRVVQGGGITMSTLAGSGTRMVVADANGLLSTQAIPSGGGGSGTVTSVGLTVGSSGTDVNVSNSPITTSGNITLNIPDASATARGLVNTGTQTFAGDKTFSGQTTLNVTRTSATNGSYGMYMLTTYNFAVGDSNKNIYTSVDALKLNFNSGALTGDQSYNVTANLNQVSIEGNASTTSTQPIRGIISGILGAPGGTAMRIADYRYFDAKSPDNAGLSGHVVTTMYGLKLSPFKGSTGYTITNGWGIYQEGTQDNNYFAGSVVIGSATVGSYKLDVTNNFRVNTGTVPVAIESFANPGIGTVASVYSTGTNSTIAFGSQANDTYLVGGYVFIGNQSAKLMITADNLSGGYDGWGSIGSSSKYMKEIYTNYLVAKATFNRQTGSYTLVLGDAGKVIEMNVGSANTLTVPTNASVALPIGTQIRVVQYGAGQTTIGGAGVTFRSRSGWLKISAQYGRVELIKVGTDEWYVVGDLAA